MPAGEAYDVVVVRDPTMTVGAIMSLSRDLAHLTGVKQADVELALQRGRFVVYPGLDSQRVKAAAEQLRTIGAVVQIKAAEPISGDQLEPDLDQPCVGRFDGPVAHFADALNAGAFNTGAGVAGPPSYNEGIGRVLPTDDGRTNRYEPVPPSADDIPLQIEPQRDVSRDSLTGQEMRALADGLDAAAFDAPEIQTIDGMDGAAFDAAEEAAQKAAVEAPSSPEPNEPSVSVEAAGSATPASHGPPAEAVLTLDLPQQQQAAPTPLPQPTMTGAAYSGTRPAGPVGAPPGPLPGQSGHMPHPAHPDYDMPEERGLLFEDPVANTLGLIAACCFVCVVLAFGITRATKREPIVTLEDEIAESYRSPLEVEFGKQRAPTEIEAELEELYESARFQFLLVLALGIPLGLGLGRIRR